MFKTNILLLFISLILINCTPPSNRSQALRDKFFARRDFNAERFEKFKHAHDIDNVDYDIGPYHTDMIRD